MSRQHGSITDAQARRLARLYAHDVCVCSHERRSHADRSGAARRCQERSCPCVNYAWTDGGRLADQ